MQTNPFLGPSKPFDYHAIAIHLVGRSPLAAALLAIHMRNRKTGIRRTSARTFRDKAKRVFRNPLPRHRVDSILQLYSEFGLGRTERRYGELNILWNSRTDIRVLGSCCDELWTACRAARKVEDIGKGITVVCMLPQASLDALQQTGLAKLLEIENVGRTQGDEEPSVENPAAKEIPP